MSPNHGHDHDHDHEDGHGHAVPHLHFHAAGGGAPKAIVKALVVTFIFMLIEVAGGVLSNSLALLSDAGHMLTDIGAMLLSLFAIWVARRPATAMMSFGYHRAEILGALASGLLIWLLAGVLVYEAIVRLESPPEVHAPLMLGVATIGLLANGAAMIMMHSARKENINVRAAYLHLLADSLGSVGAIIAGLVLLFTGWRPIDPLVTLLFAALMLVSSWNLVKEAVGVLMESTPTHLDPSHVKAKLESLPGVREVHDLHIWAVSAGRLALSVHLIAPEAEHVLASANDLLKSHFGIVHTTIQVEHPDRFASERCYDCSPPEAESTR